MSIARFCLAAFALAMLACSPPTRSADIAVTDGWPAKFARATRAAVY